jgi:hypothetical protein
METLRDYHEEGCHILTVQKGTLPLIAKENPFSMILPNSNVKTFLEIHDIPLNILSFVHHEAGRYNIDT